MYIEYCETDLHIWPILFWRAVGSYRATRSAQRPDPDRYQFLVKGTDLN